MSKKILTIAQIIVMVKLEVYMIKKQQIDDCATTKLKLTNLEKEEKQLPTRTICTEKISIIRKSDNKKIYDETLYLKKVNGFMNIVENGEIKTFYDMSTPEEFSITADKLFQITFEIDRSASKNYTKPNGCMLCFNVFEIKFYFTDNTINLNDIEKKFGAIYEDPIVEEIGIKKVLVI